MAKLVLLRSLELHLYMSVVTVSDIFKLIVILCMYICVCWVVEKVSTTLTGANIFLFETILL